MMANGSDIGRFRVRPPDGCNRRDMSIAVESSCSATKQETCILRDWCNILGSKELREHCREKSLPVQTFILSSRESQSLGWATQAPAPGHMSWGHSGTPDAVV